MSVRVSLRYLFRERLIGRDLSPSVESPRAYRWFHIPRSISWEEVGRTLQAVDRRTPTGKRDDAMLLLGATYGLRAGDVTGLTLDNINCKGDRLLIPERKAGHCTAYPLSPLVGHAIPEYLRDGLRQTPDRHVFFRHPAPQAPLSVAAASARASHYLAICAGRRSLTSLGSRRRQLSSSWLHAPELGCAATTISWGRCARGFDHSPVRIGPRRETARRIPFLFDPPLGRRLLQVADQLPGSSLAPLRAPTYRMIFALLYGLGLRVGEVSRRRRKDIDLEQQLLTVRDTEFSRSRLVPQMELKVTPGCAYPRVHDLRFSFAVGTLLRRDPPSATTPSLSLSTRTCPSQSGGNRAGVSPRDAHPPPA